jgi:photosystem II stability/assembly factor-like uncharacterized protein
LVDLTRRLLGRLYHLSLGAVLLASSTTVQAKPLDEGSLSGLGCRNIGPGSVSGRVSCLACRNEPDGRVSIIVGSASGGVWKSMDGGTTFKPIFDDQPTQSIGAIAIDPVHPKTLWIGTGESWMRNSVSVGQGIFKSVDDGQSWTHCGLLESEHISKIVVDPKQPDTVYACVPGKLWSDSKDRGLYKTTDAGKHWTQILKGKNLSTGCSALSLNPSNPKEMLAANWDFRRKGWEFRSGGEGPSDPSGSGLYRSTDAGASWKALEPGKNGLPAGPWGRIEVEYAPSDAKLVYAFIECTQAGLYCSEDGGKTWTLGDKSRMMVWRPFYFANLVVDPTNPKRVFKTNLQLVVSEDGGKSFSNTSGGSHCDWHDVWIDPKNPKHLVGGDDGGLWISYDGGNGWNKADNLPISQFYHVSTDLAKPYRVYGGMQDNSSWVGDSAYPSGITNNRWENLYGGDGFWTFPDPIDPNYIYAEYQGGGISRIHRPSLVGQDIQPQAGPNEKLRFNWNAPVHLSPNRKGDLYIGSQFLFRSRNQGRSWQRLSPDLTSNDPARLRQEQSGGITVDNSVAEMHCTIYSISESPKQPGQIWVGTDDGRIQLTLDDGKSWTDLSDRLPENLNQRWISWIEASPFDANTAWMAVDRHTFGDMLPYFYVTRDRGQSWQTISGSNQMGYAHVIKEDPVKKGLLYAGTETGLWISLDDGQNWTAFKGGKFPAVAVRDFTIHPETHDLVIATHGRGIWIIDDLTPLRSMTGGFDSAKAQFLPSGMREQRLIAEGGWPEGDNKFSGRNPAAGAVLNYYQPTRHLFGPLKLEVLDSSGKLIDSLNAQRRRGLNRVEWSMATTPPRVPKAAQIARAGTMSHRLLPGSYKLRLTKGSEILETPFEIVLDSRASFSIEDRKLQIQACQKIADIFNDMTVLVENLSAIQAQIVQRQQASKSLPTELEKQLKDWWSKLEAIRKQIVATKEGGAVTGEERLRELTDNLYGSVVNFEGRPTDQQAARVEVLRAELQRLQSEFDHLKSGLRPLSETLEKRGLSALDLNLRLSQIDTDQALKEFFHLPTEPDAAAERD